MPKAGVDAGKSIAWLMTLTPERQQLVRENSNFQEKFLSCNWNVAPPDGLDAGKSIAWLILIYPELIKLLVENSKFQEKFLQTNWDAMPKTGIDSGRNISWLMLCYPSLMKLLAENSNFQEKFLSCNWNVAPPDGVDAGKSIAWFILIYPELSKLLVENSKFQEKFLQTNWDAMPKAGVAAGKSIAWLMTLTPERQQLVRENSNFQEKFLSCNWNVAPPDGLDAGKSIAWLILIYPELIKLLVENSKFQEKFLQTNWDAMPKTGIDSGRNINWLMLCYPSLIKLLAENPKFQEKFLKTNWDTAAQEGAAKDENIAWRLVNTLKDTEVDFTGWITISSKIRNRIESYAETKIASKPGVTLLYQLSSFAKGRKVLKLIPQLLFKYYQAAESEVYSPLHEFIEAADQELITAALLMRAPCYHHDIAKEKRDELHVLQQRIKIIMQRITAAWEKILLTDSMSDLVLHEIAQRILIAEMPECHFLLPICKAIIGIYLGYSVETMGDQLAALFVHQYRRHHITYLANNEQLILAIENMRAELLKMPPAYIQILMQNKVEREKFINQLTPRANLNVLDIRISCRQATDDYRASNPFEFAGVGHRLMIAGTPSTTLTIAGVRAKRLQFFEPTPLPVIASEIDPHKRKLVLEEPDAKRRREHS